MGWVFGGIELAPRRRDIFILSHLFPENFFKVQACHDDLFGSGAGFQQSRSGLLGGEMAVFRGEIPLLWGKKGDFPLVKKKSEGTLHFFLDKPLDLDTH